MLSGGLVVCKQHSQRLVELLLGLKQDAGLTPEGAQAPHRAWGSRSPLPGAGRGGWGCWYKTDPVCLALSSYIPSTFTFSGDKMSTESCTYLCCIVHAGNIQYPTPWLCPEGLTRGRYYLPWLNHNAFDWKAPNHCECTSAVGRSANDQL